MVLSCSLITSSSNLAHAALLSAQKVVQFYSTPPLMTYSTTARKESLLSKIPPTLSLWMEATTFAKEPG